MTVQGEDGPAGEDGVNPGDKGMPGDDGESVSANAGSAQPITAPLNKAQRPAEMAAQGETARSTASASMAMAAVAAVAAVAAAIAPVPALDILINSAGIGLVGGIEETALADFQRLFRVNVEGTFLVTRALMPQVTS